MNAEKHQGQIVRKVIKDSGYTKTFIAERMNMSRNTLHNKLGNSTLSAYFLYRLGKAIRYDFTKDFPELKETDLYKDAFERPMVYETEELIQLHANYTKLLEEYNRLLKFLVQISEGAKIEELKKEVEAFMLSMKQ